ncbi:restriction endonuclease subunit S [Vibrio parahaemolyticus]|uniref:restriction endonuclease subunit S n=1 Tax=Vibrio parahaemolyticus TaxID=670 RepID=UPI00111CFD2A|nr:restriction endonuclease subunit S [Vibrio parahaemolyticus]TOA45586.1 restriction endonuclease subunit S [Vibrio parahaemolyticus]TOA46291.1 restriction endonuclease subunit S [Vibrio parahaemolyticus]TOA98779.1 restriction endonuclease subunit S [Vibrio parahaemolyticus]HCG7356372.1 restriction endonuclease subunit S [Vibrio parahaemolyticus]
MTGRYKAYPEYKRFNSTWFDSLPSHWQSVSMKWITNLYAGGTPSKDNLSFWENGSIPWLNSGSVNQSVIKKPSAFITRDAFNNSSAKWIPKGSLVMALAGQGKTKGMVAQLAIESTCNQSMAAIVPSQIVSPRFLFWWLTSNYQKIRNMAGGDLRDGLNLDLLGNISCPIFECKEQQKIANFLDHETAKIDTLIAKQEKLIELLKEKRQAVISHAVTKGLNPDAPMKDSGVEWLGEVPERWVIKSYRYACKIYRGKFGHRPRNDPAFYDGEYPFIQTGDVARAGKYIKDYKQTLNEKGVGVSQKFPVGTLMMAIAANIGDTAILGFEAYAPDSVVGFKPKVDIDLEFLRYSFIAALPALEQTSTQSTQANLNVDRIGAVQASFPSVSEQKEIVAYLDSLLEQYDDIESKSQKSIELMNERKTALISAAVTGKIDVRDWQEPKEQQG